MDGQGREAELRAKLELRQDDTTLYVLSNGVPTYQPRAEGGAALTGSWTGVGANRRSGREDRNPNAVSAQEHVFYLPRQPTKDPKGYYHDIYNNTGTWQRGARDTMLVCLGLMLMCVMVLSVCVCRLPVDAYGSGRGRVQWCAFVQPVGLPRRGH